MSEQQLDVLKKKMRKTRLDEQSPTRVRLTLDQIASRVNNLIERRDPSATLHPQQVPAAHQPSGRDDIKRTTSDDLAVNRRKQHHQQHQQQHKYHVVGGEQQGGGPRTPQRQHNKVTSAEESPVIAARAQADDAVARSAHYINQLESEVETLLSEREKICAMLYRSASRETLLELSSEEAASRQALMLLQFESFTDLVSLHSRRLQLSLLLSVDTARQLTAQIQNDVVNRRRESPAIAASAAQAVVLNDLKKCIDDAQTAIRSQVLQSSQRVEEAVCGKVSATENVVVKAVEMSRSAAVNGLGELRRMMEVEMDSKATASSTSGRGQSPIESLRADRDRDRMLADQAASLQAIDSRVEMLTKHSEQLAATMTRTVEASIGKLLHDLPRPPNPSADLCKRQDVDHIVRAATAELLEQLRRDMQQHTVETVMPSQDDRLGHRDSALDGFAAQFQSLGSRLDEVARLVKEQRGHDEKTVHMAGKPSPHLSQQGPIIIASEVASPSVSHAAELASSLHLHRYLGAKFSALVIQSVALETSIVGEKLDCYVEMASQHLLSTTLLQQEQHQLAASRPAKPPAAAERSGRSTSPKASHSYPSAARDGSKSPHSVRNVFELPLRVQQTDESSPVLPPPPAMRPLLPEFVTVQKAENPAEAYAVYAAPFVPADAPRRNPAKLQSLSALKLISGVIDAEMMMMATTQQQMTTHPALEVATPSSGNSPTRPAHGSRSSPKAARNSATRTTQELLPSRTPAAAVAAEGSYRNFSPVPLCPELLQEAQQAKTAQIDKPSEGRKEASPSSSTTSSSTSSSSASSPASPQAEHRQPRVDKMEDVQHVKPQAVASPVMAKSPSTSSLSLESIDTTSPLAPPVTRSNIVQQHPANPPVVPANDFDRPSPPSPAKKPESLVADMSGTGLGDAARRLDSVSPATTPRGNEGGAQRRSSFDSLLSLPTPRDHAPAVPSSQKSNADGAKVAAAAPITSSLVLPQATSHPQAQGFSLDSQSTTKDDKGKKKSLPSW